MKSLEIPTPAGPSILCVIDFSDSSLQALQWSIAEALKQDLHISVLYPYRLNQTGKKESAVQSREALDRDALTKFERMAEGILRNHNVSFDFRSEVGFVRDRIREHVRSNKMVMLVMGKKLAINNADSLHELLEEVEVPMVIVPPKESVRKHG